MPGNRPTEDGGDKQFKSFLRTTFSRLLTEYHRKKYGRSHIPAEIVKRGDLHQTVYRLLCFKKYSSEQIIQQICMHPDAQNDRKAVEEALTYISANYPHCGQQGGVAADIPIEDLPSKASGPEEQMIEEEKNRHILTVLGCLGVIAQEASAAAQLPVEWNNFRDQLKLSEEEKLFLKILARCALESNANRINITMAGRLLNYNPNQAASRYREIRKKIINALTASGLSATLN